MNKLFIITRSDMRKTKAQTASTVVLILIASLLLNIALMLSTDYKANFDRYHDKLNSEHVTLSIYANNDELSDFLSNTLKNDSSVSDFQLDNCINMYGTFPYNGSEISNPLVFTEKDNALTRKVGKAEIVEHGNIKSGVYLPILYKSDEIDIGKTIEFSSGNNRMKYTVCGFFNSVMIGSHNCGMIQIILTSDKYDELINSGHVIPSTLCSLRLRDRSDNQSYEASIKTIISERFPNIEMNSNCYNLVSQSRYISQMVCSGIISAMAFLVLLITLVVIASNIINYTQVNIQNLGAMKAIGYTSNQLVASIILQFSCLSTASAVLGTILSYLLFPFINTMMISQTGIPYKITFLPFPFIISIVILEGSVALTALLSSHRIRKTEPIAALRSGIHTHNFKRNYIPLEKTKAPLNLALALKTTFSNVKQNITICITMLVLSLIVVFSGLMFENFISDMTPFLNLIVGETTDSCIGISGEIEKEFIDDMESDKNVDKIYLQTSAFVIHKNGSELMATMCDDFSKVNNQNVVYCGRFPKYDNEIAVAAKYAKENRLEIGNEIEITLNGKTEKYLICGFTQLSNYLGRDCLLTRQGYERLETLSSLSYYINLKSGVDIDEFNSQIKEKYEDNIVVAVNVAAEIGSIGGVYVSLMTAIVIAVIVFSVIIVAFVLFVLVRTMFNKKKHDYGILKSIGYITKQLILQTALSFMPAIFLSLFIGITVSCFVINPLTALFLSEIGIVKCTFRIPVLFITAAGIALVLISFLLICLLSLKIKKITPQTLLVGE